MNLSVGAISPFY